jgi:hypothetical protein
VRFAVYRISNSVLTAASERRERPCKRVRGTNPPGIERG